MAPFFLIIFSRLWLPPSKSAPIRIFYTTIDKEYDFYNSLKLKNFLALDLAGFNQELSEKLNHSEQFSNNHMNLFVFSDIHML